MTIEEKARAFDEALDRCKEWASDTCEQSVNNSPKDIAEFIFPQLAENEDEKIREFLIGILSQGTWRKEWPFSPNEVVAYLERQNHVQSDTEKEYVRTIKSLIFNFLRGKDEVDRDYYQRIENWLDGRHIEQKEKKPIEFKNDELVEIIKGEFEGFRRLLKKKGIDYEPQRSYWEAFARLFDSSARKYVKEQKPVNDTTFEKWLDDWYQGSKEAGGDVVMSEAEFKNWSREIRNMYQQKSAEWSEEDEDMRDTIIHDLKRLGGDIVNVKPAYKAEIDWLKSLRPSWKPSEEQIGALNYAYCELFKREDVGHNILGPLQELLDNLKKMM